ncbi:hypothetical protein [Nitratifractor sp.]
MSPAGKRFTPRQIEKYKRQKYIQTLEKFTRNLFRMFRDPTVDAAAFSTKFRYLLEKLDACEPIRLDSEYLTQSEAYIREMIPVVCGEGFDDETLDGMREEEMTRLNRLQKMKNRSRYQKAKYGHRLASEGWE